MYNLRYFGLATQSKCLQSDELPMLVFRIKVFLYFIFVNYILYDIATVLVIAYSKRRNGVAPQKHTASEIMKRRSEGLKRNLAAIRESKSGESGGLSGALSSVKESRTKDLAE